MSDKRCGVLSAHGPHAWGDLNWCPGSMTSVPPAQPPAAPETDVSAWVAELTEAHRDSYPMGNIHHGTPENPNWGTFCVECKQSWPCDVSRLLERVRVVGGERDRWQDKAQEAGEAYANANSRHHEELDRANRLERMAERLAERAVELEDDARAATARAESAEAAHEAEAAAHAVTGQRLVEASRDLHALRVGLAALITQADTRADVETRLVTTAALRALAGGAR